MYPYDSVAEQMTDLLRERKGKVWVREGEGGGRGWGGGEKE